MNSEEVIAYLAKRIQRLESMLEKSIEMNSRLIAPSVPPYHSYNLGTTEIRLDREGNLGIGTIDESKS